MQWPKSEKEKRMLHIAVVVDLLFTLDDCLNINKAPVNFVTFSISDFSDSEISHIIFSLALFFLFIHPWGQVNKQMTIAKRAKIEEKDFLFATLFLFASMGGIRICRLPNIFLAHRLADCDCLANRHATNYRDALDSCTYRHDAVDFFPPMLLALHFLSH